MVEATKVRRARAEDAAEVASLFREFYTSTHYAKAAPFSEAAASALVSTLLGDLGVVQVAESGGQIKGLIAGLLYPVPVSPQHKMVAELAFYVQPELRGTGAGKALLRKFEQVAKQRGATFVVLSSLATKDPHRAGKVYESAGYSPNEFTFIKEI
jgi:GNAT superfamily N-acetyltransferase